MRKRNESLLNLPNQFVHMKIIDINDLPEWRANNPDAKEILVQYSTGISKLIFKYKDPSKITRLDSLGQYDGFGRFHFIDENGTLHICYPNKPNRPPTMSYVGRN